MKIVCIDLLPELAWPTDLPRPAQPTDVLSPRVKSLSSKIMRFALSRFARATELPEDA